MEKGKGREGKGRETEELVKSILDILEALGDREVGLTQDDIHRALILQGTDEDPARIRTLLNEMTERGKLEDRRDPNRPGVRLFNLPGRGIDAPLFVVKHRDEIEREERTSLDLWQEDEAERERLTVSVMEEIARGHAMEEGYAREVREVAPLLANENPVRLLIELAEWVAEDLNDLAEKARQKKGLDEGQQLIRELGFRRVKAEGFLQRLWRFDRSVEGWPGILDIPTVSQMLNGGRVRLDREKACKRLKERVLGERVIEVIPTLPSRHKAVVGTDASVGDIHLKHERGSFIPPTPATLFVSAAALRVVGEKKGLDYFDYDLDPRELDRYRDVDAAIRGFLIAPHLRREAITDFRHLRSAAMELRQYREELRVVLGDSTWRPIGGVPELRSPPRVSLLIRDGRIFPLVHRLDDYDGASAPDDVLYGEVVRQEINTFHKVFHQTAGLASSGPVYAGAVKSPEYSWLAMLVFWYIRVKRGDVVPSDAFYRPPLSDQAVVHLLFWGLAESRREVVEDPQNVFATFRVIRRFSDIAFFPHPPLLVDGQHVRPVDEDEWGDWLEYIRQHIKEASNRYHLHQRGVPALDDEEEYRPFLDLCLRAGVAMFYCAPARMYGATLRSGSHFLMPRWEIALDVSRKERVREEAERRLSALCSWLTVSDGLVVDESHAAGGFEDVREGLPLFVPNVVMEAHKAVDYARDRHATDVQDELLRLVAEIRNRVLAERRR